MRRAQKVHIAYDDIGERAPAVVLLHGLFEDRSYYAEVAAHLERRHRVLNLDLRGHGESEVPAEGYSLDTLSDDVVRVCEETDSRQAVFCSHSMALALRIASRRPDLAAGVVPLDGALLLEPQALQGMHQLVQALDTPGWREALLGFFSSEIARGWLDTMSCLALPQEVMARPGLAARVMEFAGQSAPHPAAPTRAELLDLVAAPAVS